MKDFFVVYEGCFPRNCTLLLRPCKVFTVFFRRICGRTCRASLLCFCRAAPVILLWLPRFCTAATLPPVRKIGRRLRAGRAVCRCRAGLLPAAVRRWAGCFRCNGCAGGGQGGKARQGRAAAVCGRYRRVACRSIECRFSGDSMCRHVRLLLFFVKYTPPLPHCAGVVTLLLRCMSCSGRAEGLSGFAKMPPFPFI